MDFIINLFQMFYTLSVPRRVWPSSDFIHLKTAEANAKAGRDERAGRSFRKWRRGPFFMG